MYVKKITTTLALCASLFSINAFAAKDASIEDETCDNISVMGSMIMQVRQFRPEITEEFLLSKVIEKPSFELTKEEKKILEKSQKITSEVIKKAYLKKIVDGDDNKKNAIIAFQVQVYDYCIKEITE